jgi:hypothetical protein
VLIAVKEMASSDVVMAEENANITQITQLLLAAMDASFNSRFTSGQEQEDRRLAEAKVKSAVKQILMGIPATARVQQPQAVLAEGDPGEGQQAAAIPSASGASSSSALQQPILLFNDEWEVEKLFIEAVKDCIKDRDYAHDLRGHVLLEIKSTMIQDGIIVTVIEGAEDAETPVARGYRRVSRIVVSVSGRGQKARVKLVGELLKDGVFEEIYLVNTTMNVLLQAPPGYSTYNGCRLHYYMHISAVNITNPGHKLAKIAKYLSPSEPLLCDLVRTNAMGPCGFTIPGSVQNSITAKMHLFQLEMLDMKTERARLVGGLWHPETPVQEGGYEKYATLTGTLDELIENAARFGDLIRTSMRP